MRTSKSTRSRVHINVPKKKIKLNTEIKVSLTVQMNYFEYLLLLYKMTKLRVHQINLKHNYCVIRFEDRWQIIYLFVLLMNRW